MKRTRQGNSIVTSSRKKIIRIYQRLSNSILSHIIMVVLIIRYN